MTWIELRKKRPAVVSLGDSGFGREGPPVMDRP